MSVFSEKLDEVTWFCSCLCGTCSSVWDQTKYAHQVHKEVLPNRMMICLWQLNFQNFRNKNIS